MSNPVNNNAIDTAGRAWAKLSQTKAGDKLIPDGGFTCMRKGLPLTVQQHATGLYVECDCGFHFIEGQADDGEHMIGFYPAEPQP